MEDRFVAYFKYLDRIKGVIQIGQNYISYKGEIAC